MPAADPALGLSGFMAADNRPQAMTAEPAAGGTSDLARAARSLESVQGNVSGQTMAINNMAMTTQSTMINVNAQMSALSAQLASLSSNIGRLSGAMVVGGMGMAAPPMPMPPMTGGGGGFQIPNIRPMGAAMGTAGFHALGGLHTLGAGFGAIGAGMAGPFMGTPIGHARHGAALPVDVGMMRALAIGTGLGVTPQMMRQVSGPEAMRAGAERFGDILSGGTQAAVGSGAGLGVDIASAGLGARFLGPAMGFARGGLGGALVGGIGGNILAAPLSLAIGQTMSQAGEISQFGGQFRRNAMRLGDRRPTRAGGAEFGREALDIAIGDLALSTSDVRDIAAGMFSGDLARGTRTAEEAGRRLRELSQTTKIMARVLGGTYQEMTRTASELQGLGINVTPANMQAAVFGAGAISGLTGREGMAVAQGLAQPFVGMGLGAQGFQAGIMSANVAQGAIQRGALTAADVAAVGGRGGAQAMLSQNLAQFISSPAGMAMLAAGMRPGGGFAMPGGGINQILGQAAQGATGANLMALTTAPQQFQRQAMEDPTAVLAAQSRMAMDAARQLVPPGGDLRTTFTAVLGQMTGKQGAELETLVKLIEQTPAENKRLMFERQRRASDEIRSQQLEQTAVFANIGRAVQRLTQPAAEGLSGLGTELGVWGEDVAIGLRRGIYGIENVNLVEGPVDLGQLRERFAGREARDVLAPGREGMRVARRERGEMFGAEAMRDDEEARRVNDARREISQRREITERHIEAANRVMGEFVLDTGAQRRITRIRNDLSRETNPEIRRRLISEALSVSTGGAYADLATTGAQSSLRGALERQVGEAIGVSNVTAELAGIRGGGGLAVVGDEERERLEEDIEEISEMADDARLGMNKDQIRQALSSPAMREYMEAARGGVSGDKIVDPRDLLKMREQMTGPERQLAEAFGRNVRAGSRAQQLFQSARGTMAAMSGGERLQTIGRDIGDVLRSVGVEARGLAGDPQQVLNVLESGIEQLTPEKIEELRKRGAREDMVSIATLLSRQSSEGEQRQALATLLGDPYKAAEIASDGIDSQEKADAIVYAQTKDTTAMTVSRVHGRELTTTQAQLIESSMTEYRKLADSTKEIAGIVAQIKGVRLFTPKP